MSTDPYLVLIFYAVLAFLGLLGLAIAIQVFRRRLSWGAARRMGIPMTIFFWMNAVYGLVLFEGAFGLVSIILEFPLWTDILIFVVILGMTMLVYFKLLHRDKFKPTIFTALFLVPLSVPGIHTAGKVIQKFAPIEVVKRSASVRPGSAFPQKALVASSGYSVAFPDAHSKGSFGDALTAERLMSDGYREVPSKVTEIKGIDGVYLQYDGREELSEVLVVENKVDGGTLKGEQMTDAWVNGNVAKMLDHSDAGVRQTGYLIRENPDLVRKELWHHELNTGITSISTLDAYAKKSESRTETILKEHVRGICKRESLDFDCFSTIGIWERIAGTLWGSE